MKNGFIKVASGTVDITVADTYANTEKIIERIKEADKAGANLLVLPELCVTGYSCGDIFANDALISSAETALSTILKETESASVITVVGLPCRYLGRLYDCAAIISRGEILGVVPKTTLSASEARHFASASALNESTVDIKLCGEYVPFGSRLLFECDGLSEYCFGVEIGEETAMPTSPSVSLASCGAGIICNPAATAALVGSKEHRRTAISALSLRLVCGYISSNASPTESTGDKVFSSHGIIAENGKILAESKPITDSSLLITDIDIKFLSRERQVSGKIYPCIDCETVCFSQDIKENKLTRKYDKNPFIPDNTDMDARAEEILEIQSYGLKKRLSHTRSKTAVIGISGGLDSTLALLVTARAFDLLDWDRKNIEAVTMPCFGTTKRTKSNAVLLCEELGVSIREINIKASVTQHFADIGQDMGTLDVTYENSQARERTQVLMDIANMKNGLVIGTGDISELALGWATYNGDHMSMYGVNGSVPKTLIRYIVRYEAERLGGRLADVLYDILDTPVSPELLPANDKGEIAQKTEDLVGPYELHDFFLYYTVRCGFSPAKIFRIASHTFEGDYSPETIMKWLKTFTRRFFTQQFKRSCLPDGPKVGSVSLSPRGDLVMPTDASYSAFMKELDEISIN